MSLLQDEFYVPNGRSHETQHRQIIRRTMPPKYNELPGAIEVGVWRAFEAEFNDRLERSLEDVNMTLIFASSFFVCVSMFVSPSIIQDAPLSLSYNDIPLQFMFHYSYLPFCPHRSWFTRLSLVCNFVIVLIALVSRHQINLARPSPSTEPLRNRCRLGFLRLDALEKAGVPFVLELLLPALIAVSMICFFVGLLASISYGFPNAVVFGASALGISSLLPILHPDCAYKAPLTHHCFTILNTSGAQQFMDIFSPRADVPLQFDKLRHIEVAMVKRLSDTLDLSVLVWLFNGGKSSWSVEAITLQALSSLPLESIPLVGSPIVAPYPISCNTILQAIQDDLESCPEQTPDRFDRLQRTALRFESGASPSVRRLHMQYGYNVESRYTFYRQADYAQQLVIGNLLYPPPPLETNFDAILWAKIFAYAIESDPGLEWLGIDNQRPSEVWAELLRCAVRPHGCRCREKRKSLLTFELPEGMPALEIDQYDREVELDDGMEEERRNSSPRLASVFSRNMRPSFLRWLIHVGFSHVKRNAHMKNLPDDIFLFLAMLQTPSIQKTSTLSPPVAQESTLFHDVLLVTAEYLVEQCPGPHTGIDKAAFIVLEQLIESDSFGSHTIISLPAECLILESVFLALYYRFEKYGAKDEFQGLACKWITPDITSKILIVALQHPLNTTRLVWGIMSYLIRYPRSNRHVRCLERVYTTLLERSWLQGMAKTFTVGWQENTLQAEGGIQPIAGCKRSYTGVLASLYIDGLRILSWSAPDLYKRVVDDLSDSGNPSTMCRMLLLSDEQSGMWEVARILDGRTDGRWVQNLVDFSMSDQAKDMSSGSVENGRLKRIAVAFANDVANKRYTPLAYHVGSERLSRWLGRTMGFMEMDDLGPSS